MTITNKANIPQPIVDAIKNDSYSKGFADYSVTGLLKPALQNSLYQQHKADLTEDASDRIFSLLGQLMHGLFERSESKNCILEKRLFAKVEGKIISGQIDVIDGKTIQDYKFTTIYKLKDLTDFTAQLNMYRYLCYRAGIVIDKLQIVFIFRDWYKTKSLVDPSYPQQQVKIVDIDVWTIEETEQFIKDRIAIQENGTPCTDVERWATGGNFAVMKNGKKRALKLFDDKKSAEEMIEHTLNTYLEERKKTYKRCEMYCNVSQYCDLYQKELEDAKN